MVTCESCGGSGLDNYDPDGTCAECDGDGYIDETGES